MSMTIGEATATAQVPHAIAQDKPVSPDRLADANLLDGPPPF